MKKAYRKPEVCSIDFETGNTFATSDEFAAKTKSNQKILMEMSISERSKIEGGIYETKEKNS